MSSESQSNSTAGPLTTSTAMINEASPKGKKSSPPCDQVLASGAFRNLIAAVNGCAKYQEIYSNAESMQDRFTRMELDMVHKNPEIQKHKDSYDHLMAKHETRLLEWAAERKELEATKKELADRLERERKKTIEIHKQNENLKIMATEGQVEIEQLKKDLKLEKKAVSSLKITVEQTRKTAAELNAKSETCEEKLHDWEGYCSVLHELDIGDLANEVHKLWTDIQSFAETYFMVEVSPNLFKEYTQWDNLTAALQVSPGVPPLPPRNSEAAKQARMAAVLAVLAVRLTTRIFAPVYIPTANEGIRELLMRHADVDIKREAACRALLLSAYEDEEQRQAAERLVLDVADDVIKLLSPLLNSKVIETFRTELEMLIRDAAMLWRRAQRSAIKIEASIEDATNWEWNDLNVFSNANEGVASESAIAMPNPRSLRMITLFPRVFVVHEDEWELVFPGVALWDWQISEAEQELRECLAARRVRPVRGLGSSAASSKRDRRKSDVDRIGSAFSSPADQSFLDQQTLAGVGGNG